jgi:hypothetical protein
VCLLFLLGALGNVNVLLGNPFIQVCALNRSLQAAVTIAAVDRRCVLR